MTEQYAKRDMAFIEWLREIGQLDQGFDIGQRVAQRSGFAAGWEARKRAEYSQIVNQSEKSPIDRRTVPVSTLFPTTGELGG